ncbi:MAG: prepilin-type N-terminal cleavage/methylation domain-containing protein [Pseudomonadota bacterium]
MHKPHSSLEKPDSQYRIKVVKSRQGFSLIEVTLAIAIIATAFVALLGLLPAGLQIFRTTVDATNITRITTDITTMLQATEYAKLADLKTTYPLYYYDADGGFLDSDTKVVSAYEKDRVYAVRVVLDQQNVTGVAVAADNEFFKQDTSSQKALVVVGKYTDPSKEFLRGLKNSADVAVIPANGRYKVLPILIAKTDGNPPK